jgi:hypothetical protein
VTANGQVRRELLLDFNQDLVESSWLAVGDGDGRPELVLATGWGESTLPGISWVLAVRKSDYCLARRPASNTSWAFTAAARSACACSSIPISL